MEAATADREITWEDFPSHLRKKCIPVARPLEKSTGSKTEIKIRHCDRHGEFEDKNIGYGKKIIWAGCPQCAAEWQAECDAKEKAENEKRLAARRNAFIAGLKTDSGIPFRYSGIKLSDFVVSGNSKTVFAAVERYIARFPGLKQSGCSLIMCGKPGTGKTHLACAIGNELLETGESVRYTTAYRAVSAVKATYSKTADRGEVDVLAEFQTPDLLIVDEVGVQFGSETEKLVFYQIINDRYENILPTILISNLDRDEVGGFIGERTIDRLREGNGAVLVFDWGSYRPGNKKPVAARARKSALERYLDSAPVQPPPLG